MKKYILIFCIASLSLHTNESIGQILVTTGCGEVQFGNSCNFKASGTLGGLYEGVQTYIEYYHQKKHQGIGMKPNDAYYKSLNQNAA